MGESQHRTHTSPQHNLPQDITPFLGRDQELKQLRNLIADPHIRLISIVGMGGMGKSRLAIESGRQHIKSFSDGVFFVSMADIASVEQIPATIVSALGILLVAADNPLIQLQNYCQNRELLLIIDNVDHLIEAASTVNNLLEQSKHLKVLVTTRQRLRVRGETVIDLMGMSMDNDNAQASDMVQLFLQSARRSNPQFALDDDTLWRIVQICAHVQGMPLAIELAASWVNALTIDFIQTSIKSNLDFLETEFQDVPARQRSIRQIIAYSLELLTQQERETMTQLAVFRGGFQLEAAEYVTNATTRILVSLINRALLQHDGHGRYHMHELLRQYAAEALQEENRYIDVNMRHARYFAQKLDNRYQAVLTGSSKMVWQEVEADMGNIHAAWDWMSQNQMHDDLIRSSPVLILLLEHQNRYSERFNLHKRAISVLSQHQATPERDLALGLLYSEQTWSALRFGHFEDGIDYGTKSWNFIQSGAVQPLDQIIADGRMPLAIIYALMGELKQAYALAETLLKSAQLQTAPSVFNIARIGFTYYVFSTIELLGGKPQKVIENARLGYQALQSIGHKQILSYLLNNWGSAERMLGNLDTAKRLFLQSYEAMEHIGSSIGMATALTQIATISLEQGNRDDARSVLEQNSILYRDIGDHGELATALNGLAQIALIEQDYQQAADLLIEALEVGISLGNLVLSVLVTVGELFISNDLVEPSRTVLSFVLDHPACTDEIKRRISSQNITLDHRETGSLHDIAEVAAQYLRTGDWAVVEVADSATELTERELDILSLLAKGMSNKEIASTLILTVGTVKWYLNQIYSKLYVSNRTEAVLEAQKRQIIPN